MSLPDQDVPPTKSPSKSRWEWARLNKFKPFAKSVRHITEFYIQPDDPHRHYCPGDVVTGNVMLKVIKPVDVTHIVICLHGFAQVYKRPNEPGEGYRNYNAALISGKTNKAGGYYGNGFVSLFEDEVVLCGDGRLDEGTYQFGFELHFPQTHLPSGIDVSLASRRVCQLDQGSLTLTSSLSAEQSRT
jgi:arrestin-related trafficking adapter 9